MSKSSNRVYPDRDLKLLFGWAAGRCAFPNCGRECLVLATTADREAVTGKIAHIYAHADGGPRANPTLSAKERDSYPNWVLLCSDHHDLVDAQPSTYTSEMMLSWKEKHEAHVREMYRVSMPQVTFAELAIVANAIRNNPIPSGESFVVTPPQLKMNKNGLTTTSSFMITLAIGKAKDVEMFVREMNKLDPYFADRLRTGFVAEYDRLITAGFHGDSLFSAMQDFATGTSIDFTMRCAGLAVLGYLFEKCEVFEP